MDAAEGALRLADRAALVGLHRIVVPSALGRVVVRVGKRRGDVGLILLHGAAGSWATWLPLIEEAKRVGQPLTNVVAIDLPGWGESGELSGPVSVEAMADVVVDVVTALGYAEWSIVGHSLGGHLALDLAARVPESTRAATVVSATGPTAVRLLRHPLRGFATLPWLAGMLAAMRALTVFGRAGLAFVRILHHLGWLRWLASPLFALPDRVDGDVIDALSREVRPQAFLHASAAARNFDERAWGNIRCPVLVLEGERDVFVGSGDAPWFEERLMDVSHGVIPRAGHFAHAEQPGAVLDRMRAVTALAR